MNTLVSLPIVAATPTTVPAMLSEADPIFAALDALRSAEAAIEASPRGIDIPDDLGDRRTETFRALMRTRPTTPAGLAALTGWMREKFTDMLHDGSSLYPDDSLALAETIDDALRGMAGLQSWSPSIASAAPSTDPTFIAIDYCRDARKAQDTAYAEAEVALSSIEGYEARRSRERAICDGPADAAFEAFSDYCEVKPTTVEGLLAKLVYAGDLHSSDAGIFDFYRVAPIIQHLAENARALSTVSDLAHRWPAGEPDPIFEALETWQRAKTAIEAAGEDDESYDDAGAKYWAACLGVMHTRPTTPSGLAAYTGWLRQETPGMAGLHQRESDAIFATLDDAAREMSGLDLSLA